LTDPKSIGPTLNLKTTGELKRFSDLNPFFSVRGFALKLMWFIGFDVAESEDRFGGVPAYLDAHYRIVIA
jgi:hypothetical protein